MLNHLIYELIVTAFFLCFASIMTAFIYWSDIKGWLKKKTDRLFYKMGYSPTYFQPVKFEIDEVIPVDLYRGQEEFLFSKEKRIVDEVTKVIKKEIAFDLAKDLLSNKLIEFSPNRKFFKLARNSEIVGSVSLSGRLKVIPPKTK